MVRLERTVAALVILACSTWTGVAHAGPIFSPGDFILGGASDGTSFVVGQAGSTDTANNWPAAEGPEHMVDGVGQKYLNFAGDESGMSAGALVTPGGGGSIAQSITFWTANDAVGRDPASFALYGTNAAITAASQGDSVLLSTFDLIASGNIALPDTRNAGGSAALLSANSLTVGLTNIDPYTSYLLLFPTIKDASAVNSMQIAEVQLDTDAIPASGPIQWSSAAGGNDHWYEFVRSEGVNWFQANAAATSSTYMGMPGQLATILSVDENGFVYSLIDFAFGTRKGSIWLGGVQAPGGIVPDGDWTWVTGEPWVYTNWSSGEPNDSSGAEQYLTFDDFTDRNGTWNDWAGTNGASGYVIEYAAVPEPATLALMAVALAGLGFSRRRELH